MQNASRTNWKFDGYLTRAAVAWDCREAALGQANGKLRRIPFATAAQQISSETQVHKGGLTALVAHPLGGYVSGGEDGCVMRIPAEGAPVEWAKHPHQWIEVMAILPDGRLAYAVGKNVLLLAADGSSITTYGPHDSTVMDIALHGESLVACHYNGATLWKLDGSAEPRKLVWKGSHLAVVINPEGTIVATSTQEGDVHGWRLDEKREMRMSGYQSKVRSLAFSADGQWLCTSGAEVLVAWPFDGPGPEGRAPLELVEVKNSVVTRVAAHPHTHFIACGYEDGTLAMVDLATQAGGKVQLTKRGPVTCLAWSRDGHHLVAGADDGRAMIFSVPGEAA